MHPSPYLIALRYAVAIVLAIYIGKQVKKPDRFAGRFFAWLMNGSHAPLTDWAFTHLKIPAGATALDVGCGGGRTIEKLSAKAAQVYGVDYAAGSVASSRAHNRRLIADGRVHVEQASVSHLPFADNTFDLVTAIETQYYWPDLNSDMKVILRVLKPDGRLMVVAENYKGARNDAFLGPVMKLLGSSRLSVDDHRELFRAAGYEDVEIHEERRRGWICIIGTKPAINRQVGQTLDLAPATAPSPVPAPPAPIRPARR
ncbi:MAG TPA: methyltransferase domain-containing protein [Terracidiphilus sp.]|nr:methyltransferase domain-containing protein [Terracidiphilus sp.]